MTCCQIFVKKNADESGIKVENNEINPKFR